MLYLPNELLKCVYEYLDLNDLCRLVSSNKELSKISEQIFVSTDFQMRMNKIIDDDAVKWLEKCKVKHELLYKTVFEQPDFCWIGNGNPLQRIKTTVNGKKHSINDIPSEQLLLDDMTRTIKSSYWHKNDLLHRDNDLPAIIYSNGTRYWYQNGQKHRDNNLPAVICSNGKQEWYRHGIKYKELFYSM